MATMTTMMASRPCSRRHAIVITISIALASLGGGAATASPPRLKGLGGFRLPWETKSSSSSSLSASPRGGGAAAAVKAKKRSVMKGSASSPSSPAKKGSKKKMKKRIVRKTAGGGGGGGGNPKSPAEKEKKPSRSRSSAATAAAAKAGGDTMPSIFRIPSEEKYDRYAAALAVTEGLRRVRDAEIARASSESTKKKKISSWLVDKSKVKASPFEAAKKRAEAAFLLQSTKAVMALGMTATQFNQIGREVMAEPALRERVSEQAYLYRIASAIHLEKIPLLEDPASKKRLESKDHKRYRVQLFARSVHEIEDLRAEEMESLRRSLHVERFPPGFDLSDPNVQPLLHPEVRMVCEKFPIRAEEIVKRYGLDSDEFNRMLEETKGNPIFRWRVQKYVEKAGEEKAKERRG